MLHLLLFLSPSGAVAMEKITSSTRSTQYQSKECGFGYGEDAHCVPCRPNRFKEARGPQKCKPCLDCALVNRFQRSNCSTTGNAVCGDCIPGFYRKTRLSGFQDMECIPCGDPPPPYEPHCSSRVNLVPLPSTVTSPRDVALAAVICSALATVLLALLTLCVIYCKRQLLEKKPSASLAQVGPYNEAELSCFDRRRIHEAPHRTCCQCHQSPGKTCGPVHLIPALCCDEACSLDHSRETSPFHSLSNLSEVKLDGRVPLYLGRLSESRESWPLMQNPDTAGSRDLCQCATEPKGWGDGPLEEEDGVEGTWGDETPKPWTLKPRDDQDLEDQHHQDQGSAMQNESQAEPPHPSSLQGNSTGKPRNLESFVATARPKQQVLPEMPSA